MISKRSLFFALLFVLAACEEKFSLPDGGADGSLGPAPRPPRVEGVPSAVPYPLITLRGSATDGRRVLVQSVQNPMSTTVLPDGTFCIDVRVDQQGTYTFAMLAQSRDGQISSPTSVQVTYDEGSAAPVGATTCSGADPEACANNNGEICDNNRDDDCDGRSDAMDPDCTTCEDDSLEPNDVIDVPTVPARRYDNLKICPGNKDFYRVTLAAGDVLRARALFRHADGDLDLEMFAPNGTSLGKSESSDDDEELMITASDAGNYVIEVYAYDAENGSNTYSLDIAVNP